MIPGKMRLLCNVYRDGNKITKNVVKDSKKQSSHEKLQTSFDGNKPLIQSGYMWLKKESPAG